MSATRSPRVLARSGRGAVVAMTLLLVLLPLPARGVTDGQYQRMYLLGNQGKFLYWSFNPAEEEASQPTMVRRCGGPTPDPCYRGTVNNAPFYQFSFNPLSRPTSEASWGPNAPLRFHLELAVDGPVAPTAVQLMAYTHDGLRVSDPATQVSPGVWEGALKTEGSINATQNGQFSVRVQFPVTSPPGMSPLITMGMAGASWIELPAPVTGRSVRDMRRMAPPAPAPSSFATQSRQFSFNDQNWHAHKFEGDLAATRDFTITLPRHAVGVMGIVEMFEEPAVHQAVRRGEVAPERVTDAPTTQLVVDGVVIANGANSRTENAGRGSDTVATIDAGAGPLTLRVAPAQFSTDLSAAGEDNKYTAYLVVIYGERTLGQYSASYTPRHSVQTPQVRAAGGGACAHHSEMLPVSSAAALITGSMYWTHNYTAGGFGGYPCGESGTGTEIATVMTPNARVLPYGAVLSNSAAAVSNRDVVIHETLRVVYSPEE
jgi:hypothetical protein